MKLFVIALFYLSVNANDKHNSTLELVQILFRHGERSPSRTYTNDPYKDYKWQGGWNQLSNRGKLEMYNLGVYFRKHYAKFLSEYYSSNETYILSSYAERCHMSAQLLLAGLYPPKKEQVWTPELLWQPIPINDIPRHLDNLIAMKKKCPVYDKALKDAYNSEKFQAINRENADLYQYLSKFTGDKISNISHVEVLYNTLEIETLHNLTLPSWTESVFPGKMKDLAAQNLAIFTDNDLMKRLKGGVFLKRVTENMNNKRKRELVPDRKLFLFSGHDITIVNIMRTLGFENLLKPGFGASLTLELHKAQTDDYFVQLFYRNSSTAAPELLGMKSCGEFCSLDEFVKVLQPVLPDNWEEECKSK